MVMLIAGFVFIDILIIILLLASHLEKKDESDLTKQRLQKVGMVDSAWRQQLQQEQEENKPLRQRLLWIFTNLVQGELLSFTPQRLRTFVDKQLKMADVKGWTSDRFLIVMIILALSVGSLVMFAGVVSHKPLMKFIPYTFVAMFFTLIAPFALLHSKIKKRRKQMEKDLPEALDLLTVSVEAGLSFDGALLKLSEKMKGALIDEFTKVLQEIRFGQTRRQAMLALASRCQVEAISVFTAAVVQADHLGISIGKVLRIQSKVVRTKKRQRIEQEAMKAPLKMLFPMVIFIFPTIFIVLLGPALIRIMSTIGK